MEKCGQLESIDKVQNLLGNRLNPNEPDSTKLEPNLLHMVVTLFSYKCCD